MKAIRKNWWHDPKARPPHHKARNVRLTSRLINGGNVSSVQMKRDPEAITKPHRETAEQAARRALQVLLKQQQRKCAA